MPATDSLTTKPKVNLAAIAQHCGVSRPTVSRVLNNRTEGFSVRDEVRTRILSAAEELGYRPNLAARTLKLQQTNLVAVLGIDTKWMFGPGVPSTAIDAATQLLHKQNYDVCACLPRTSRKQSLPPWQVDGVIVVSPEENYEFEELEQAGVPYVTVNGAAGASGSSVLVDDQQGTRQVLDHLYSLGHRNIAYVSDKNERHSSERIRRDTYVDWMVEKGLAPVPGHDRICRDAKEYMNQTVIRHNVTAVLAYSHLLGVALLTAAGIAGVSVPDQVSVVCFNDEYPCQAVHPALSAVRLPSKQMGEEAAQLLLDAIASQSEEGSKAPRIVTLPEELILRESCARFNQEN